MRRIIAGLSLLALTLTTFHAHAAEWGLKPGTPKLQSAGPLAFGPDGILLVGDNTAATIFAIATGDEAQPVAKVHYQIDDVAGQISKALKSSGSTTIKDMAVNPDSGNVYFSVVSDGEPSIVRLTTAGKFQAMDLANVKFLKAELRDAPSPDAAGRRGRKPRDSSITDIAYVDGRVIVSGLSSGKAPSAIRELVFPFQAKDHGASVEIYHGAHGKFEDYSPVQTFVPFNIGGKPSLLAGYICTPLVRFPLDQLQASEKVRGTTVAELGNRNRPLDMIVYKQDGKDYLLLSNSARGVMKISTENIAQNKGITSRVSGGGTAGQEYETIKRMEGVVQLDKLDDSRAVVVTQTDGGLALESVALP